jgi:hypothetical protein
VPTAWRLAGRGDLDGAAQILRAGDAGDREAVVRLPGLLIKQGRGVKKRSGCVGSAWSPDGSIADA